MLIVVTIFLDSVITFEDILSRRAGGRADGSGLRLSAYAIIFANILLLSLSSKLHYYPVSLDRSLGIVRHHFKRRRQITARHIHQQTNAPFLFGIYVNHLVVM